MELKFYTTDSGRAPVDDFISGLDKQVRAKILSCLENVQKLGLNSPMVEFRQIDGKLWEIKIKTKGGGFRLFYVYLKTDLLVLLHAYKKQTQKAPTKEMEIATKRLKEVMSNETDYTK